MNYYCDGGRGRPYLTVLPAKAIISVSMPSSRSHSSSPRRRHLLWYPGQQLSHYRVLCLLGDGTFGRVLKVEDSLNPGHFFALKVIRPVDRYTLAAHYEAEVLESLQTAREFPAAHIVSLAGHFQCGEHYCLLYELLGPTLYDVLKSNQFQGFAIARVQAIGREMLQAVSFLHTHKVVHTDLKLENVSFAGTDCRSVKLIDFGSAVKYEKGCSALINTRQYRAPEVVLGLEWDERSDVWSLGCVFAELYTGELLFPTHDDYEHIAMVEKVTGKVPAWMAKRSTTCRDYFDARAKLKFPKLANEQQLRAVRKLHKLDLIVHREHSEFRDLLGDMLQVDPRRRATAGRLLRAQFFARSYS